MQQRPQDMSASHTMPGATGLLGHVDRVLPKGVLNRSEDECSHKFLARLHCGHPPMKFKAGNSELLEGWRPGI